MSTAYDRDEPNNIARNIPGASPHNWINQYPATHAKEISNGGAQGRSATSPRSSETALSRLTEATAVCRLY